MLKSELKHLAVETTSLRKLEAYPTLAALLCGIGILPVLNTTHAKISGGGCL